MMNFGICPVDPNWLRLAEARQLELTKPPGSLGRLEEIANRCVAIFESLLYSLSRPRIVLFAGDHGVCAEGVSPYPSEVTAQMVLNFLSGGAAINCLSEACGIELQIVDVGVAAPLPASAGLISRRIAAGTRNFCHEPAMTRGEADEALAVGIEMARAAVVDGCHLLGFGEMGIGNTTAAAAITAALTGCSAASAAGRGTGADDACFARKISAIERALELHGEFLSSPGEILARLGGLEIAAMCGFCLGAASCRRPVVMDGLIATAAAALAVRIEPNVKDYLFAAHLSPEPGHQRLVDFLKLRPLLQLDMRLGEGTGAALAMKLMIAASAAFTGMATFGSAGVSGKK
ncbi:MAG: nicotinate-nucleotide--dimethylbenzimidazole phosphoribosyltransferase [Acidobacteriia bacterium]|nr:nicotinate-nucleotide--dimethylbenzimidazole phosphoribosyltransferase [Terriglobia bacterium]